MVFILEFRKRLVEEEKKREGRKLKVKKSENKIGRKNGKKGVREREVGGEGRVGGRRVWF